MEEINYLYEDFFMNVDNQYKDFVAQVNEMVLQEGYSKVAVSTSKTYLFSVKYTHPKTRRGIVNFTLRKKKGLMATIFAVNHNKYPQILNGLPEKMVSQIAKKHSCGNITDPGSCMAKCVGYDFYIGETHYQKCRFGCFQFDVDAESVPILLEMLTNELEVRRTL